MANKYEIHTYHAFIFVDGEYMDSEVFTNTNTDEVESKMSGFANEHFQDNSSSFKIVLVNLDTNGSNVYEYVCEKIVKISCNFY